MHCGRSLALCVFLALSLLNGIVSSRGIVRRQNTGSDGSLSAAAISQQSTQASNINSIPGTTGVKPTATGSFANKETSATQSTVRDMMATGTSTNAPAPTVAGSYDGSKTIPENSVYSGGLPIEPKVTPGIGIAGVILMITGVPFCLIGIKVKVLQIFLSTFFLSGLGITVLIIYVMNPPVSDAVQGAYVTAVAITGIITGCLAVVFPEVTEALGCLLGGFCISMWFLVIKPGGLVSSVYGKLIMIAAFCFVTFSLAFHKITRPYSLIFSISFGGATAIVLGIDCFSRAGLKEFWIYIWALNDNVFPLETNNYPHTRGIRVELAVIILITAFGVMSQVKLWKILKERREVKDAEKRRQVADLEALDEDVGRRVEEGHKVERAQWEVEYGGKEITVDERPNTGNMGRADSGLGDDEFRKKSGETVEEFVETEDMRKEREEHIHAESRKQPLDVPSQQPASQDDQIRRIVIPESVEEVDRSITPGSIPGQQSSSYLLLQSEVAIENPNVPPTPEVIPLPVPIPMETEGDDDEVSSLATWAESDRRLSGDIGVEVIITPTLMKFEGYDEDRASSVAATCDDEGVLETAQDFLSINGAVRRSVSTSNTDDDITPTSTSFRVPGEYESGQGERYFLPVINVQPSESGKDSTRGSFERGVFTGNHSKANTTHQTTPTATSPPSVADTPPLIITKFPENLAPASSPKPNAQGVPNVPADLSLQLQARCSRVVKNYRTNEWAKHLADAETPELEKIEVSVQPMNIPLEVSVPVHIKELQETSEVPSRPPSRSTSKMSQYESVGPALVSSPSFPLPASVARPAMRTSSVPVVQQDDRQGAVSPVERCVSPPTYGRHTPSPLPQNTLMGKRESMVRSRQNFNTLPEYGSPSPTPDLRSQSPNIGLSFHPSLNSPGASRSPTPNMYPTQNLANDTAQYRSGHLDDDMSLADRRNELLNHSVSQNMLQGRRSFSPQPQQTDKREAMMKSWRESIKTDQQASGHAVHSIQERRGEMLNERQQLVSAEKQRESFRDEMLEERMRQKDMLELHKEALRRLQASANQHI